MSEDGEDPDVHQTGVKTPEFLQRLGMRINPVVFFVSAGTIVAFVVFGALFSDAAEEMFLTIEEVVSATLNWWYVGLVTGLLVFVLYIGLSRHGRVRLGGDDDTPDFSLLAWFTMLFAPGWASGCSTTPSPSR